MPDIKSLLIEAKNKLSAFNPSARLDAEILLAFCLGVSKTHLYTWPNQVVTKNQAKQFYVLIDRRIQGEPIAYIVGRQAFWSLDLEVTKATLIPRPETELLIEIALKKLPHDKMLNVVDLGTGSGAIALALAHECPAWQISAVDQSAEALSVAKENARRLRLNNVIFYQGQWCAALPKKKYDAIVSNPPYIAQNDQHLQEGDVRFEPFSALVSGEDGLDAIRHIAHDAKNYLREGGLLLLEHGFDQGQAVRDILHAEHFTKIKTHQDLAGCDRVVECGVTRVF